MIPLDGVLVVDASRMLPGAVLARQLIELGARLIKVEQTGVGDPMRWIPPAVDGCGAGFRDYYAGAESLCLDLRRPEDARRLIELAGHADVLIENFRPASSEAWGIAPQRLAERHPRLVVCTLSGFGNDDELGRHTGHDLNFTALSGALELLRTERVPRMQLADVTSGLLACSAIVAALLARATTGNGAVIDQPLVAGPLPFLSWALADRAAGGGGLNDADGMLAGACPAYRLYTCGDDKLLAVATLEPKYWVDLLRLLGIDGHDGDAFDTGERGRAAAERIAGRFAAEPRAAWLRRAADLELPLSAVHDLDEALEEPVLARTGVISNGVGGSFWPSFGRRPAHVAPTLGQHDRALRDEFGLG